MLITYNIKNDKNKLQVTFNILDRKKDGFSSPNNPNTPNYSGPGDDSFYPGKQLILMHKKYGIVWGNIALLRALTGKGNFEQNEEN